MRCYVIKGGFEKADHHRIAGFKLAPEHDAMRSFVPDEMTNGTRVFVIGAKGKTYILQGGKVVNGNGRVIFDSKSRKNPKQ